jgi:sodium-dependent phosphate cotransporter
MGAGPPTVLANLYRGCNILAVVEHSIAKAIHERSRSSDYLRVMAPPIPRIRPAISSHPIVRAIAVVALLFLFLLGVNGLGDAFKSLGGGVIDSFFAATRNPFMGLMVGILATTAVQSSSVTTSLIVGLVAAPVNPLPIANAVPMVMGANIGTTVTNTIVSMAHMGRKREFYNAFSVATCHDFFNYMAVLVLLPLEMATGYLQRTATAISSTLTGLGGMEYDSPIKGALKAALAPIKGTINALVDSQRLQAVLLILVSAVLIYIALMLLVRVMRTAMRSRVEVIVSRGLHKAPAIGILVGVLVTVMVQSSSITTSLLVPLAGAGIITLAQAFPITIGANIGTTVTALLAALAVTGPNARWGITIALVHLLFNLSGTLLIYSTERIRNIPLTAARRLAAVAVRSRRYAILYVVLLFYGVPALFAVLNRLLG